MNGDEFGIERVLSEAAILRPELLSLDLKSLDFKQRDGDRTQRGVFPAQSGDGDIAVRVDRIYDLPVAVPQPDRAAGRARTWPC